MRVTFFQRRPRPGKNFSLEQIFDDVRANLAAKIEARKWLAPYFSSGLFKRLIIGLSAFRSRDEVNHVTGDINFVTIFLPKRRTVLTILDIGILSRLTGLKYWFVWLFWFQLPVWRSAYVTVISNATRESLLETVRCSQDKVIVVPVAISETFVPANKEFDELCPTILQVGTGPNKNLTRVIEALQGMRCKLWIIGHLTEAYKESLQANKIDYCNWEALSNDEVVERYKNCDMVAFVSTFEGFGMPILEANATGKPVITANVTSMPEVAGDAAYIVDPYDVEAISTAFRSLIRDKQLREKLVANGFENVKRYNTHEISRQYLEVYNRVAR